MNEKNGIMMIGLEINTQKNRRPIFIRQVHLGFDKQRKTKKREHHFTKSPLKI